MTHLPKRELFITHMGIRCKVTSEDLIGCVISPTWGVKRLFLWTISNHKAALEAIKKAERISAEIEILKFPSRRVSLSE